MYFGTKQRFCELWEKQETQANPSKILKIWKNT